MENEKKLLVDYGLRETEAEIFIPNDIREEMGLKEGSKVLFALTGDSLTMKKVSMQTFAEITKPLKEAMKKSGLKESDVVDIIHRFRTQKRFGK